MIAESNPLNKQEPPQDEPNIQNNGLVSIAIQYLNGLISENPESAEKSLPPLVVQIYNDAKPFSVCDSENFIELEFLEENQGESFCAQMKEDLKLSSLKGN